jgi:exonuclease III
MELSVAVFCWNVQSVRYADNNSQDEKPEADFIEQLAKKLEEFDLVFFALQEDSIKDSPIVQLLKEKLIYQTEIESIELSGWGSTTYKAIKRNMEYLPRGLRLIAFKSNRLSKNITAKVSSYVCPSIRDHITWGKGAVAIHLDIEDFGKLTMADFHLPFSSKGLRDSKIRKDNLEWQTTCFDYLYQNLKAKSDNIIIAGDLNFRVDAVSQTVLESLNDEEKLLRVYNHNDELKRCMNFAELPYMREGIKNMGPAFNPTCKLFQRRETLSYNTGKYGQRTPSWCDRILYTCPEDLVIECLKYDRYEYGNMCFSDHAAVIGEYIIKK